MTDLTGFFRMADGELQVADRLGKLEEELRRRHRHEDETVVVLEHADLEEAGDAVAAHPWDAAEGADAALRRDELQHVAGPDTEPACEMRADEDSVFLPQPFAPPLPDVAGADVAAFPILPPQSPPQPPRGLAPSLPHPPPPP